MGRWWVGAWARTCLSSSSTSYSTCVPASPDRPATINWIKLLYRAVSLSSWSKISSNGSLRCFIFHYWCNAWVSLWIRTLECFHFATSRVLVPSKSSWSSLPFMFFGWVQGQALHSIIIFSKPFFPTWTEHVFVAVLCHFLETHTRFTTMGRWWVAAWARTFLSSSTTSYTTFAPVFPSCPATIHWNKKKEYCRTWSCQPEISWPCTKKSSW